MDQQELIDRALAGDRGSLEQLLLTYYDQLKRHVQHNVPRNLRGIVSSDDILQQTYVRVFNAIDSFTPQREGSFYAWLKTIASRQLLDAIKRRGRERRVEPTANNMESLDQTWSSFADVIADSDFEVAPALAACRHELVRTMQVAVAEMPDDYRHVIHGVYLEGRSLREVAKELGRSEHAVRGLAHRARERLREAIVRLSLYI